ncbi:hypothetical protein K1T71_006870 [Dendrolimus kikuchii]|uniref:Uncharacterized protein n=1 Tax=Dendrolimus kikuchii TaxID=765133 RepID=A0ACC1D3M1_9NEOP|nr:hypothetical protein K1T71_006870 [Dendrolimus kikuchii]
MSETDDTDVLLLIPPNFFLVQSSSSEDSFLETSRTVVHRPVSCTAQVLNKLVGHVQSLESRLENLEVNDSSLGTLSRRNKTWNSTDSFDSWSLDRKCFTFPRRRRRKVLKKDKRRDLSLTSVDSGSTQDISHLKFSEDINGKFRNPRSMDGDISSIGSTPSKKNDKLLLHEIDEFLNKVESYESPESKYKLRETTLTRENVIKATGNYLAEQLDSKNEGTDIKLPSGRVVSSNVLDKYIYLVKNHPPLQTDKPQEPLEQKAIITNQDNKSPSVRKLNFDKDVQPTSTPKNKQAYSDNFRPSSNKIYDRASKILEQYKSQNNASNYNPNYSPHSAVGSYLTSPKKEEFKLPQMRPFIPENKETVKLAMQNKFMDSIDTDLLSLSDLWGEKERQHGDRAEGLKLEEERLKREHCEAMIQQLQKKILEQQEKLAVAIKVDRSKDAAIAKLRDSWLKLTGSLDRAEERHKNALEKMIIEMENFRTVAENAQKKTNHFESELYKALDLAHDYQEKCKQLTNEKKELENNTQKAIEAKNEVIVSKDKEINLLKENYETVMRLNKQSTDCVKNLEDALEKEKLDHESSKLKANELTRRIQTLKDDNLLLLQERDLLKVKVNEERGKCNITEQQLCEKQNQTSDLLKKCDFLDNETKTLRKLLDVQKNELKSHYQKQLEDAVLSKLQEFQQQLDVAEREMENDVRTKENAIIDSYNKQITRIEEQHKLEVNVLEEKQKEEIKLYRLQLAQASEKIGLLENKLESYRRRRGEIASQLHGVMEAQWRQALLILTSGHLATPIGQDYAPPKIPPLTMPPLAAKGLQRPDERRHSADTMFNFEGLSDNELQQYVKLLLTKPPNLVGSGDCAPSGVDRDLEEPTSDRPDRKEKTSKRSLNASKPPWKA